MKPPVRLMDDERLSPGLRAGLREARDKSPVTYDEEAGFSRFAAAIALPVAGAATAAVATKAAATVAEGVGTSVIGSSTTTTAVAVTAKAGLSLKLVLGFVAATAVGTGAVVVATRPSAPPPVAAVASNQVEVETPKVVEQPPAVVHVPSSAVAPSVSADLPKADVSAKAMTSAPRDKSADLQAEMAQYAEIRAASGDPARALELANEGQAKFPRGTFGQEREVIAINALKRLGRADEAKRRADAFIAAHPESPLATSLKEAH